MLGAPPRSCPVCASTLPEDAGRCTSCGCVLAVDAPLLLGRSVGDGYCLRRKLGQGGHGVVYEADHPTYKKAAVKVLRSTSSANPNDRKRFLREAHAIPNHPNAAKVYDSGETQDGLLWIAMELLEGETLRQLLDRKGPLTEPRLIAILGPICDVLEEAHQKGIVHRDLKPENIFLVPQTGGYLPKLLDFGIAGILGSETMTNSNEVSGSPRYMAPEQWEGLRHADARSDIYSLGVITFQCLSGRLPFEADSVLSWMKKHCYEEPLPLSKAMGTRDFSEALSPLLDFAMAKDPKKRPQSALLFKTSLQESLTFKVAVSVAKREPERPSPKLYTFALGLLLLLLGGAFGFYVKSATSDKSTAKRSSPLILLMDTPVPRGVYDADALSRGETNADTLNNLLRDLPVTLEKETLPSTWNREKYSLELRPDLVVIHRSAFFHALNVEFGFDYPSWDRDPPFLEPANEKMWRLLYRTADDKLISFLGLIGTTSPQTTFLVYSRGTDGRWQDAEYRKSWISDVEERFPALKGRIMPMLIAGGVGKGSLKANPENARQMRQNIISLLGLSAAP